MTYQKAVREQRMAAEISAAKRERDFYLRCGLVPVSRHMWILGKQLLAGMQLLGSQAASGAACSALPVHGNVFQSM